MKASETATYARICIHVNRWQYLKINNQIKQTKKRYL